MTGKRRFRVVIAGGGVAGLTLANALERAGVDYVLLEKRNELAPQVGASIGIQAHGARILDQLGVWDDLRARTETVIMERSHDWTGHQLAEPVNGNILGAKRTGYQLSWGERQVLLEVLATKLHDKSRALVEKDIVRIDHERAGVTVWCADGTSYEGDVLVGADGVFSKTRERMWELAETEQPEMVKMDRKALTAEYNCLFGVAMGMDNLSPGDFYAIFGKHQACLLISATGGKLFYFVQERLPAAVGIGNLPRYTDADKEAFVQRNGSMWHPPNSTIADMYKNSVSSRLVPVEEGKFQMWTWGRIACVGDSVHKAAPNLGSGGNAAIESAAALANVLKELADECYGGRPTLEHVQQKLEAYQRMRQKRAASIVDAAGQLIRVQTLKGRAEEFFARHIFPNFRDFLSEMITDTVTGAVKLDFLPLPLRSLLGTRPFNPSQGEGRKESKRMRALVVLPLLVLVYVALDTLGASKKLPWALNAVQDGTVATLAGDLPMASSFYGIRAVDTLISKVNTPFLPALYETDPASRRQLICFLADCGVLLTIWLFESVRRANTLSLMQLPIFFGLAAQFLGVGVASSFYCFVHYIFSPVEKYAAADRRLTRMNYALGTLPVVLTCYYVPGLAMFFWPDLAMRQTWLFVWRLFPIWVSVSTRIMARVFPDTFAQDAIHVPRRDLPVLALSVVVTSLIALAAWLWTRTSGLYNLATIFMSTSKFEALNHLGASGADFLRFDHLFTCTSLLLWLVCLFWDLKSAGMLQVRWLELVLGGVLSVAALGPGATVGMGWLWREWLLATRQHKDALTEASVARLHPVTARALGMALAGK